MKKTIFVVGGVMSSVGKGVTTASIGNILRHHGYTTEMVKCEMYLNIDAGTIRPTEHGEVFVAEDGTEADQDLGNYERFTQTITGYENYITHGQLYQDIIKRERNLEYEGEDVEIIPDVPNEIIRRIELARTKHNADITIVEIGGTVGEYQNLLFLEAARIMKLKNPDDVAVVMVSYIPKPPSVGELKTKPTQHAVRALNAAGINPSFLVCRAQDAIDEVRKEKLSLLTNVKQEHIIAAPNIDSIYKIPEIYEQQEFGTKLLSSLALSSKGFDNSWQVQLRKQLEEAKQTLKIGIIGKYFETGETSVLSDSYISVIESAKHACWALGINPELTWINSETFEQDKSKVKELSRQDALIVPGGFGTRGIEGKIEAIKYARENKIPLLGICYGLQLILIEYARNVLSLEGANTTEADKTTKHPIIDLLPEQQHLIAKKRFGATMRLGAYSCSIQKKTIAYEAYKKPKISERHRHRYEFNNTYKEAFENSGVIFSGINPESQLVEIAEIPDHPFLLGCQFHPEFQSHPLMPHPLFHELIKRSL